ncbi:MAG: hypothetical protein NZM00_14220 [Anaerolinea sp.]|nr:hypothetical protein [Anaerolinea sp.]
MRDTNNNHIPDAVEDLAAEAVKDVRELGRQLRQRADEAKKEAVKALHAAADTIRREARDKGLEGDVLKGAHDAAHHLERAATYLKRSSFEDIGEDAAHAVKKTVRRNTFPVLVVVLFVGILIGLLLSNRD